MPEPHIAPDDIFHVMGFSRDDISNGGLLRMMEISDGNLKMMSTLHQRFGALAGAADHGLVVKKMLEVYFLDPFVGADEFEKKFGNKFQVVEYLNDTALALAHEFRIQLPPVIEELTRATLPKNLGVSLQAISFTLP